MSRPSWPSWLEGETADIGARDQWRSLRSFDGAGPEGRLAGAEPVVSFAGNDYLGLACHPAVVAAAHQALDRWGSGSGASRLVVGTRPVHLELERELASWKATEAALVFSTGYGANLGVLAALGGPEVTIFSDELNHASVVDGCRLSRAEVVVYPHGDAEQLGEMVRRCSGRSVVVTETVFSMDGDLAPVKRVIDICARHGAVLVLDEAHAVIGPDLGPVPADLDLLRVGTLSKALGSLGGFVAAPRRWIELLVNRSRTFIFTTAPTPADTAAALAALAVIRSDDGRQRLSRLRANIERVRPGHRSPIIPVVLGEEAAALAASESLLARGLLVPAIRPPTVPVGTSRLRLALSAVHTDDQVQRLTEALHELGLAAGVAR